MRRIVIDSSRVEYDERTDILFVAFGDFDPTLIDHEDSVGNGVYLQYSWPDGQLAFMEIWKFSKRYGLLPTTIRINGDENFEIVIPKPDYALA